MNTETILLLIACVLSVLELAQANARSVLGWACLIGFGALVLRASGVA